MLGHTFMNRAYTHCLLFSSSANLVNIMELHRFLFLFLFLFIAALNQLRHPLMEFCITEVTEITLHIIIPETNKYQKYTKL